MLIICVHVWFSELVSDGEPGQRAAAADLLGRVLPVRHLGAVVASASRRVLGNRFGRHPDAVEHLSVVGRSCRRDEHSVQGPAWWQGRARQQRPQQDCVAGRWQEGAGGRLQVSEAHEEHLAALSKFFSSLLIH